MLTCAYASSSTKRQNENVLVYNAVYAMCPPTHCKIISMLVMIKKSTKGSTVLYAGNEDINIDLAHPTK